MRSFGILAATAALLVSAPAVAEDVKVGIGKSGLVAGTLPGIVGIARRRSC